MNHKNLIGAAVAAALLLGVQAASACSISAWQQPATGLTVADTGDTGFSRYSGRCSLRVINSNGGTGRFVTDVTPNNETSYRLRFYYFSGNISGVTDIFQARNTGGTNIIRVTHDGNQLSFTTNTGGAAQTVTVLDNRYYSIELAWAAGAGTGSMTGSVRGASSAGQTVFPAPAPGNLAGTVNFANLANSADSITEARLGMIAGNPTVTAPVYFDEFDSRRTQNPGRLCRGDAGGGPNGAPDGLIGSADRILITNEILNNALTKPQGAADANEDGIIASADRIAVTNMILNGGTCANN